MSLTHDQLRLSEYLKSQQDEMISLTQQICAFATENPPGRNFGECVDFLNHTMTSMGLTTENIQTPIEYQKKYAPKETFGFPRYNLISRWNTGGHKTLHFNSHYDVVPATEGWDTDPFQPIVKEKKLFGRGTVDMKGCLVASIFAVKALQECGLKPNYNIELSFVADEEIGGACGSGYITTEGLVKPDAAVICEGGMNEIIMYGHRGVLWATVHVKGIPAHGSNPQKGINAFEKGIDLAHRFMKLHQEHQVNKTKHPVTDPGLDVPTLTLGGFTRGGGKINVIPEEFSFSIDRRVIPEENIENLKQEYIQVVQDAIENDPKLDAKIEFEQVFTGAMTEPEHALCKTAQDAVQIAYGTEGQLKVFGAFTDMHFFTNYANCPAIGYGVSGDGLHSNEEYLDVDSLSKTAQVYAEIALNLK